MGRAKSWTICCRRRVVNSVFGKLYTAHWCYAIVKYIFAWKQQQQPQPQRKVYIIKYAVIVFLYEPVNERWDDNGGGGGGVIAVITARKRTPSRPSRLYKSCAHHRRRRRCGYNLHRGEAAAVARKNLFYEAVPDDLDSHSYIYHVYLHTRYIVSSSSFF